ncbi:MAG: type II toxin-antitoxin system RelE/ParE family toxin [Candidatus Obscuribacterales bacterium]
MKRLLFTPKSLQDFQEIHDYIAQDSIEAAADFIDRLQQRCNELCNMPGMGRKRDELASGMRSSAVGEHIIFYRVVDEKLEIMHVLHGKRNLRKMFKLEPE